MAKRITQIQIINIYAGPNGTFQPGQKVNVGKDHPFTEAEALALCEASGAVDVTPVPKVKPKPKASKQKATSKKAETRETTAKG